jgi:hypothetical protein
MADLTYAEQLPVDNAGKKLFAALVDNGGVNEFTAVGGINRRTQNGEVVADMDVNVTNQVTGGIAWLANFTLNTAATEQTLVVDNTAGGVQFAAFHANTTHVFITAAGGEMRFTLRGTAPTASSGHRIYPHDAGILEKSVAVAAKFIRGYNASADGKLYLTELIEKRLLTGTT